MAPSCRPYLLQTASRSHPPSCLMRHIPFVENDTVVVDFPTYGIHLTAFLFENGATDRINLYQRRDIDNQLSCFLYHLFRHAGEPICCGNV